MGKQNRGFLADIRLGECGGKLYGTVFAQYQHYSGNYVGLLFSTALFPGMKMKPYDRKRGSRHVWGLMREKGNMNV